MGPHAKPQAIEWHRASRPRPVAVWRASRFSRAPLRPFVRPGSRRVQRPENLALRRSTKDWMPSLKSSLAKTCSLIAGMHAIAACSPPSGAMPRRDSSCWKQAASAAVRFGGGAEEARHVQPGGGVLAGVQAFFLAVLSTVMVQHPGRCPSSRGRCRVRPWLVPWLLKVNARWRAPAAPCSALHRPALREGAPGHACGAECRPRGRVPRRRSAS